MNRLVPFAGVLVAAVLGCGPSNESPNPPGGAATGGSAGVAGSMGGSSGFASSAGSGTAGATAGSAGSPAAAGTGGTGGTSGNPGGGSAGSAGQGGVNVGGATAGTAGGGAGGVGGAGGAGGIVVQDPGTEGDGDFTINTPFTAAPENGNRGAPAGKNYDFTMRSQDSQIYTGMDATLLAQNRRSFTRPVSVYVPQKYIDGTEAPFMIVHDNGSSTGGPDETKRVLDNLTNDPEPAKRVPAMILIFVANGGGDSLGSQRGLEYDTMSDRFARFVDTEVLPAVLMNSSLKADYPNFKLTSNPEGRGAYGCSSGGAAALTMGWFTNNYRRILTYSGTFVDQQDTDAAEEQMYPGGAWDYHEYLIRNSDKKPLRIFLEVGSNDNRSGDAASTKHNWVLANKNMAAVLKEKGYHYRFVLANGAGHCDGGARRATFPDAMRWMWRGYPL